MKARLKLYLGSVRYSHYAKDKKYKVTTRSTSEPAKFEHEHDYSVGPASYTYTAETNKDLFERFPLVNSKILGQRKQRPKQVRMLARDFIHDSLYNPAYGYFTQKAEIFTPEQPFEFKKISNIDRFMDEWSVQYRHATHAPLQTQETKNPLMKKTRVTPQVWHTPSELFQPHYGYALARYMLNAHKERSGSDPLIIYEIGAGNGTLMKNVLDYVAKEESQIYKTCEYNVIEISASLSLKQLARASAHAGHISITNKSFLEYNRKEERPCFVVAVEVLDNLAHDVVRYDNSTKEPHQGYVVVDQAGDFVEVFENKLERLVRELLTARSKLHNWKPDRRLGSHPLKQPVWYRYLRNAVLPFHGNLSPPEYIPTGYWQLLQVLCRCFPQHSFLTSDFNQLSETIPGYCSPVVQTFLENTPVTLSTYMALQGYFDIMFPTDFGLAAGLYEHVCGKKAATPSHHDFLTRWGGAGTQTASGENPMTSFYRNAAFLHSV